MGAILGLNYINSSYSCLYGENLEIFLPLRTNISSAFLPFIERMEQLDSALIRTARNYVENFNKELCLQCLDFCSCCVDKVLFSAEQNLKKIQFVCSMDLSQGWRVELILAEENTVLLRWPVPEMKFAEILKDKYTSEEIDQTVRYMIMKFLCSFSLFYKKTGRIFPACVKIINTKSNPVPEF